MSKRFRDEDMLAYKGGGDAHVAKRKQRNKALEIVFDPQSHKDYITGFRKRKQQRRKEALSQLEKKQRQQRIEERAERRQAQKDQLHLDQYATDSDVGEDENTRGGTEVKIFNTAGGLTSTVTVAPIKVHSDSEDERNDGEDSEDDDEDRIPEMPAASAARKHEKERQRAKEREAAEKAEQGPGRTKLSKTALKIMVKTKAKIEGKKTVGKKSSGAAGHGGKRGGGGSGGPGGKGHKGRGGGGKGRR